MKEPGKKNVGEERLSKNSPSSSKKAAPVPKIGPEAVKKNPIAKKEVSGAAKKTPAAKKTGAEASLAAVAIPPSPEVVVLPQSQNKVFLIWRAEPILDESTDCWVIQTSFGEKARVPARSRSVFLSGNGSFDVQIYRVSKGGIEELFFSKKVAVENYNAHTSDSFGSDDPRPRLNSSSQNFRRRISS